MIHYNVSYDIVLVMIQKLFSYTLFGYDSICFWINYTGSPYVLLIVSFWSLHFQLAQF